MTSWTTQELSLPAKVGDVVSKVFQNRHPSYMVIEITGAPDGAHSIAIEDSADGVVFSEVHSGNATKFQVGPSTYNYVFRFSADVHGGLAIRNTCRITSTVGSYDKVYVTWSP